MPVSMPGRITVLATGEIYHLYNRGIAVQPTFIDKRDYQRILATLLYYQYDNLPFKYSRFLMLSVEDRQKLLDSLKKHNQFLIEVLAYCFMPNHFHLLVKQLAENGISTFMSNFTNSYTRYFNTKQERNGPLFQGKFSAVRVETDEQLLHISRYIHLNPYTSYIVKTVEELDTYFYSSFHEYINQTDLGICVKNVILNNFMNSVRYKQFVLDQAEYQRTLSNIKHLLHEA